MIGEKKFSLESSEEYMMNLCLKKDLMPENSEEVIQKEKLFYLWKKYDVNGRNFRQMVDQHEYITNPQKSINYEFLLFHFSDCYFYLNELSRSQATSLEEHDVILKLESVYKDKSRKLARVCVGVSFFSYTLLVLSTTSGIISRLFALYIYRCKCINNSSLYYMFFNPIYDYGLLASIFINAPSCLKQIMNLNENQSFSKIQTQLFLRYCAQTELKKALDYEKKKEYKPFKELILIRILRNNFKNFTNSWKAKYYKLVNKVSGPRSP